VSDAISKDDQKNIKTDKNDNETASSLLGTSSLMSGPLEPLMEENNKESIDIVTEKNTHTDEVKTKRTFGVALSVVVPDNTTDEKQLQLLSETDYSSDYSTGDERSDNEDTGDEKKLATTPTSTPRKRFGLPRQRFRQDSIIMVGSVAPKMIKSMTDAQLMKEFAWCDQDNDGLCVVCDCVCVCVYVRFVCAI